MTLLAPPRPIWSRSHDTALPAPLHDRGATGAAPSILIDPGTSARPAGSGSPRKVLAAVDGPALVTVTV